MPVKYQPDGYHSLTPYLRMKNAAEAIEFYKRAFGAEEMVRMPGPNGTIAHAELKVGDAIFMLGEPMEGVSQGTSIGLLLYVKDVDQTFQEATSAGAQAKGTVETMFYGDRTGTVVDPYGIEWMVSTHLEDVSDEEMERRMSQMQGAGTSS